MASGEGDQWISVTCHSNWILLKHLFLYYEKKGGEMGMEEERGIEQKGGEGEMGRERGMAGGRESKRLECEDI